MDIPHAQRNNLTNSMVLESPQVVDVLSKNNMRIFSKHIHFTGGVTS